jgi:hypothetical protein
VTRRRLLVWSAAGLAAAVALWILQALIGVNFYDGEADPWFLLALQWIALGLVLASMALVFLAMLFLFKRPVDR